MATPVNLLAPQSVDDPTTNTILNTIHQSNRSAQETFDFWSWVETTERTGGTPHTYPLLNVYDVVHLPVAQHSSDDALVVATGYRRISPSQAAVARVIAHQVTQAAISAPGRAVYVPSSDLLWLAIYAEISLRCDQSGGMLNLQRRQMGEPTNCYPLYYENNVYGIGGAGCTGQMIRVVHMPEYSKAPDYALPVECMGQPCAVMIKPVPNSMADAVVGVHYWWDSRMRYRHHEFKPLFVDDRVALSGLEGAMGASSISQ
jgi:hypothetical protein